MALSGQHTEARKHFKEHGWARIPSLISREEADEVLQKLWKAKEIAEERGEDTHLPFLDPNASNVRIFYLMELDKVFRDLIFHPTALEMVKTVLENDFIISNFTANIARPGARSMALHSDQSLVFEEPWNKVQAMNIIWCLTDVTRENGATMYIPGSNKIVSRNELPENAPELLVPFEAKAGDIIAMDGRVWHTSGSNVTKDQDRALLFGYYTSSHIRQQVNWTAKLPKEVQETLNPEQKTMLGLDPVANLGLTGDLKYLEQQYPRHFKSTA
ncbi:putative phytanoyl-CoA dioxygenase [Truncatella angustata]|uniref:Phytanoyl-CoA dioxygenase n=1 Tax=Truncatella angustata TaxID=152316 RepID=A0A9P8UTB3_9PEZI|nr:putative phytanoyl-CoA dioxygenase [Truncatella angustata]KAH6658107.1 putative phytanoyl-CoA dioxygenase [Truncatella angustata]